MISEMVTVIGDPAGGRDIANATKHLSSSQVNINRVDTSSGITNIDIQGDGYGTKVTRIVIHFAGSMGTGEGVRIAYTTTGSAASATDDLTSVAANQAVLVGTDSWAEIHDQAGITDLQVYCNKAGTGTDGAIINAYGL